MSGLNFSYDGGARTKTVASLGNTVLSSTVAGGSSSTGESVDRNYVASDGTQPLSRYYSCAAVVSGFFTAVTSQAQVTVGIGMHHSSDGTSWEAFSTDRNVTATFGATSSGYAGQTTAGTEWTATQMNVNLVSARRYLRIVLDAPTFSGSSTGQLLNVQGNLVFTGADELPA